MHGPLQYTLDPERIVKALSWTAGILLVLHVLSVWTWASGDFLFLKEWLLVEDHHHLHMFDLDEEDSFGTWFAAILLLLAGRLLLLVTRDSRRSQDGLWLWWLILAIGFHILSIEEVVGLHEYVNAYGRDFGWMDTNWTTYGAVVALLVAVGYLPFLLRMLQKNHKRTVGLFVAAGIIYLGGAVLVEKISPDERTMMPTLRYNAGWITLEEGMEMAGVILLIYALLDYLRGGRSRQILVDVSTPEKTPTQPA